MKWYTHIIFPVVLLKLLGFDIALILLGVLATLLPDIDIINSPIGRLFSPLSKHLSKHYAHRSITHSLLALILLLATGLLFGIEISLVLAIGYLSHFLLDMLNPTGVPLFYPKPYQFVLLGGPVNTGEVGEKVLFTVLIIVFILSFFITYLEVML